MSATLNSLLEKTSNWDKDERYMATNDLCNELQKDIKVGRSLVPLICVACVFICVLVCAIRLLGLVCFVWFGWCEFCVCVFLLVGCSGREKLEIVTYF